MNGTHLSDLALGGRRLSGGERLPTWASKVLWKDNIRKKRVGTKLIGRQRSE